jgi:carbamoyl-phosphate synthase/aspartate carbamoyltransferase
MITADFDKDEILFFIEEANKMKLQSTSKDTLLFGKILVSYFLEPSTRTLCSFQSAMTRLGGSNIVVHETYSSTQKGETLKDTIKTLGTYGDAIVFRHPTKGASQMAADVSSVPIINAGDGNGEHPTQALLDVYTISECKGLSGTVTFYGDLKNSRCIHSLIKVLRHFPIEFIFVSPPGLELEIPGMDMNYMSLEEAIKVTDVLYVTRIQKERGNYDYPIQTINKKMIEGRNLIIMHPLPRTDELSEDLDDDERSVYFKQMEYGLYMRMAILNKIIKKG